jgi:hypothetical protein
VIYVDAVLCVYLLLGAAIGLWADQHEMKQHVPFGSFPSGIPLSLIRKVLFGLCVMFGPLSFFAAMFKFTISKLYCAYLNWQAKRSLRRVCRLLGISFEKALRVLQNAIEREKRETQ